MKITLLITAIILTFGLTACTGESNNSVGINNDSSQKESTAGTTSALEAQYRKISAADAKGRLDAEKGIILLDVRTVEENEQSRIPGSMLIPLDELAAKAPELLKDKASTIFIYCRSGNRSATAAKQLITLEYTNVYDMGGIINWPYEKETGKALN